MQPSLFSGISRNHLVFGPVRPFSLLICGCVLQITLLYLPESNSSANSAHSNSPAEPLHPRGAPMRHGFLLHMGESVNLTCPYEVPFYSWTHSDQPTKILSDRQWFHLQSVTAEHSGRYICQAVDGYGTNSADFAVRVIDPSSYIAQRECVLTSSGAVNPNGPCFLMSYTDRDLNPTKAWGENIVLDCDTVATDGLANQVQYHWEFSRPRTVSVNMQSPHESNNPRRLQTRSSTAMSVNSPPPNNTPLQALEFGRFTEPRLKLDRLNLRHIGEYRCVASTNLRRFPSSASVQSASANNLMNTHRSESISRIFRLNVKPKTEGPIIRGPKTTNETVIAGQDSVFTCEVNPEEHRSSTIRWGKSIDTTQRAAYEASGREVIQWAGGTFVVLPSIPDEALARLEKPVGSSTSLSDGMEDNKFHRAATASIAHSGVVSTDVSGSQTSRLVLRRAKTSDSGRYVCSVLTESGRDDHKYVLINVVGSANGETGEITVGGTRRLTVYIAVPIIIFFVCLCVVTYCLIRRRTSRSGRRPHRSYRPSNPIKAPSTAGSSSIGVCCNGVSPLSGSWNTTTDPRLRPPSTVTGPGTTTLGYSTTNGSGSIHGASHVVLTPQGYQATVSGGSSLVPGSYPMLLQPIGSQPGTPFYPISDLNGLVGYQQNMYPVSTINGNEYMIAANSVNVYPAAGMPYMMSNGHVNNPNVAAPVASSTLHSSSPESAALIGSGSPPNTDMPDGQLLFQPTHLGQQPLAYTGYPADATSTTVSNFGYQPSRSSAVTSDFDANHTHTPLLAFNQHHADNSTHRNGMRA